MDDWFSLVLLFLFVILPLIQQVIGQARRGEPEEDTTAWSETMEEEPVQVQVDRRPKPVQAPEPGGWSEGWNPWPEEARTRSAPEPRPAPPTADLPRGEVRARPIAARPVPDPHPGSTVVSLEKVTPRETVRASRPAVRARPVIAPVQPVRPKLTRGAVKFRGSLPVATALGDPAELRRAIILNEVLGPPVALRKPD